jgi:methylmalonyl-CoA mutase N-terminal domain/subunit
MDEIERNGGVIACIEDGSLERAVADAAYREQQAIERGEREVVGVNVHVDPEVSAESMVPVHGVPEEVAAHQLERLARVRAERDEGLLDAALARLEDEARGQANLMPAIVEAVEAYGSIGEICDRLAAVFGRHAPSRVV